MSAARHDPASRIADARQPRSASARRRARRSSSLAAAPCLGRARTTCACSPRSSPIWRWRSLWNLLAGYAGLVSVGQQAFVGLGGYLLFALAILAGVPPLLAIPLAGVDRRARRGAGRRARSSACAAHYFAIGTWVIAEVFRLLASQVSALGGGSGISLPAGIVDVDRRDRGSCASSSIYWIALALARRR